MENEVVIFNKYTTIERCIKRIKDVYSNDDKNLEDFNKQDIIILNLQRACQATIDMAMYIISVKNLGVPQAGKDTFNILAKSNIITEDLAKKLKSMVGFRNLAVHDYEEIDFEIVRSIINYNLEDLEKFAKIILNINET